ncbi:MAG: hypothetical protein KIT00_01680 [Rhodospirillales bacterium]|nr:hypothetical protein [Rhodospirillales bacterium]
MSSPVPLRLQPVASFRFSNEFQVKGKYLSREGKHMVLAGSGSGVVAPRDGYLVWSLRVERVTVDGETVTGSPLVDVTLVTTTAGRAEYMLADMENLPRDEPRYSLRWKVRQIAHRWVDSIARGFVVLPEQPVALGGPLVNPGVNLVSGVQERLPGARIVDPLSPGTTDGVTTYGGRQVIAGHLEDGFRVTLDVGPKGPGEGDFQARGYALVDVATGLPLKSAIRVEGEISAALFKGSVDYTITSTISLL